METMESFAADRYHLNTKELEDEFYKQYKQIELLNYCQHKKIKGRGNTIKKNLVEIVVKYILATLKEESIDREQEIQSETNLNESFTENKKQSDTKPRTIAQLDDEDHGAIDPEDSMSLEDKKTKFLKKMILTTDEIKKIERDTVGQQKNDEWKERRKDRLTASNFGRVCTLKPTTSRANTVKNILYDTFKGNEATRYGNENEPIASDAFQKSIKETIEPAGLFIHKEKPYLAASPDGLIGKNAILEIKCPLSIKEYTPEEAVVNKKLKYLEYNSTNEKLVLKQTDKYYYQIQGQLNITERNYCYFVVWTPKGFIVDKIARDVEFWNTKMEPFLTKFYLESLLPEIIEKRHERGLPIRTGLPENVHDYNTRSKGCMVV